MNPRQGTGMSSQHAGLERLITPIPTLGPPFSYMPTSFTSPNIVPCRHPDILAKLEAFQEELIRVNSCLYSLRDTTNFLQSRINGILQGEGKENPEDNVESDW